MVYYNSFCNFFINFIHINNHRYSLVLQRSEMEEKKRKDQRLAEKVAICNNKSQTSGRPIYY